MATANTPYDVSTNFQIVLVNNPSEAKSFLDKSFIPIECSFGDVSVVDPVFVMDHHGPNSHLESVAIRAYRDFYGKCVHNQKFVVTGFPDEDATFAIAALCGLIPHPSKADIFPHAPKSMSLLMRQNLLHYADLIAKVDTNPERAIELVDTFVGRSILTWRMQAHPTNKDILQWYGAVARWRDSLTCQNDEYLTIATDIFEDLLHSVINVNHKIINDTVCVADFSLHGPNSNFYKAWLERIPILVAHHAGPTGEGNCSLVVKDLETAKKMFGSRGLREVYQNLNPSGCGGRETIGGSSRLVPLSWNQALDLGQQLSNLCKG